MLTRRSLFRLIALAPVGAAAIVTVSVPDPMDIRRFKALCIANMPQAKWTDDQIAILKRHRPHHAIIEKSLSVPTAAHAGTGRGGGCCDSQALVAASRTLG